MQSLLDGRLLRVVNSQLQTNTWLLAAPGGTAAGSDCVVVDAGLDHAALDAALLACGWRPRAVLCTHGHFDHVGGAQRLQQRFAIPVVLAEGDLKTAQMSNFLMKAIKLPGRVTLPEFTSPGPLGAFGAAPVPAAVQVAGRGFAFCALPGHTPGSCAIVADGLLFSGDSLYARHVGLSRLPGEDRAQLRRSLQGLLAAVAADTLVLPGHGASATLGEIRAHNQPLAEFLADAEADSPALAAAP